MFSRILSTKWSYLVFYPLRVLRTFANHGYPDGVLYNTCPALNLGLQCLLVASQYSVYTMDHQGVLCRPRGKSPLMYKGVNRATSR